MRPGQTSCFLTGIAQKVHNVDLHLVLLKLLDDAIRPFLDALQQLGVDGRLIRQMKHYAFEIGENFGIDARGFGWSSHIPIIERQRRFRESMQTAGFTAVLDAMVKAEPGSANNRDWIRAGGIMATLNRRS